MSYAIKYVIRIYDIVYQPTISYINLQYSISTYNIVYNTYNIVGVILLALLVLLALLGTASQARVFILL